MDRKLLPLLGKSVTAKGGGEAGVRGDAQQIEQRVRAVGKAQQEAKSTAPAGGKVAKGIVAKGSKHKGVGRSKAGAVAADARQVEKLLKDVARAIEVSGCVTFSTGRSTSAPRAGAAAPRSAPASTRSIIYPLAK